VHIGFYQSAASLNALESLQRTTSHNLAASSVAGYKRTVAAMEAKAAGTIPMMTSVTNAPSIQGHMPKAEPIVTQAAGALSQTGNSLDFALQGEGFFTLQGPDGLPFYTRNGQFHLSAEGELVNAQGYPVLSGGREISVDATQGPLTVSAEGTLMQGQTPLGPLDLTSFGRPDLLSQITGGFIADSTLNPGAQPAEEARVLQGFVEGANVNPVQEMVSLITISRAYEANEKVLSSYDDRLSQTIDATRPNA